MADETTLSGGWRWPRLPEALKPPKEMEARGDRVSWGGRDAVVTEEGGSRWQIWVKRLGLAASTQDAGELKPLRLRCVLKLRQSQAKCDASVSKSFISPLPLLHTHTHTHSRNEESSACLKMKRGEHLGSELDTMSQLSTRLRLCFVQYVS